MEKHGIPARDLHDLPDSQKVKITSLFLEIMSGTAAKRGYLRHGPPTSSRRSPKLEDEIISLEWRK